MNTGDWTQVVIAIIMLLTAVTAVATAYVNYRTRPLLIRTKEMHSKDLKGVLDWWKDGIASHKIGKKRVFIKEEMGKPKAGIVAFRQSERVAVRAVAAAGFTAGGIMFIIGLVNALSGIG